MRKYIVMLEGCGWYEVEATSHEMAYRQMMSWFAPHIKICVMGKETGEAVVFARKFDKDGNLVTVHNAL